MTENEQKVAAYRAAICAVVKCYSEQVGSDAFFDTITVLVRDYYTARYWVNEDKKEAASNELGE